MQNGLQVTSLLRGRLEVFDGLYGLEPTSEHPSGPSLSSSSPLFEEIWVKVEALHLVVLLLHKLVGTGTEASHQSPKNYWQCF